MKARSLIKLSIKEMFKRKFVLVLMLVVSVISLYMCDRLISIIQDPYYYEEVVEREIDYSMENLYKISITYQEHSLQGMLNIRQLLKYTDSLQGVQGCGGFGEENLVKEGVKDPTFWEVVYSGNSTYEAVCVDWSLFGIKEPKLYEGTKGTVDEDMDVYPALVGYDLREYLPIGTVFTSIGKIKYKVVGVLEKGFTWLPEMLGQNRPMECDKKVVAPFNPAYFTDGEDPPWLMYYNSFEGLYFFGDSVSDATINQVEEYAASLGIGATVQRVSDYFEETRNTGSQMYLFRLLLFSILVVFAILCISSSTIVSTLLKKRNYGIMLANGISIQNIACMIVLKNAFIVLLSVVIAYIYRHFEIGEGLYVEAKEYIHLWMVPQYLILVIFVILIVSSILPILIIRRMKTVEMIRGNE